MEWPPADARSWLSYRNEVGAEPVATPHGLIVTCWPLNVNSYDCLGDVLQCIHRHPAAQAHLRSPRPWKVHSAADSLRSGLHNVRG